MSGQKQKFNKGDVVGFGVEFFTVQDVRVEYYHVHPPFDIPSERMGARVLGAGYEYLLTPIPSRPELTREWVEERFLYDPEPWCEFDSEHYKMFVRGKFVGTVQGLKMGVGSFRKDDSVNSSFDGWL